jgi:hypothetical protein
MNVFRLTPENQHIHDEHVASGQAVEQVVQMADAFEKANGRRSPELDQEIVEANRRHLVAHQAMLSASTSN